MLKTVIVVGPVYANQDKSPTNSWGRYSDFRIRRGLLCGYSDLWKARVLGFENKSL
jgi:hypothetical protein